jgi:hypothetical protein
MKNAAFFNFKCLSTAKSVGLGLGLVLLAIIFPSAGKVTHGKVEIPVVGSQCNDRVKEISTVSGLYRLPSRSTGPVPAVVLLHSNAGIVGVGDFYARALNAAGIATLEVDSFLPRGVRCGNESTVPVLCNRLQDAWGALVFWRQTQGSIHKKLVLQDFPVVPLLPS